MNRIETMNQIYKVYAMTFSSMNFSSTRQKKSHNSLTKEYIRQDVQISKAL
jgi:hypothetical protein